MNQAQQSRRRALEAIGLGPVWVRRDLPATADEAIVGDDVEPARSRAQRIGTLDWATMQQEVAACRACKLCETRTQTVFGVGVERPEWLIVGEAPGADEDAQGEPFVGQAGKLLDAMLAAVGFSRERDVFIANVLKCRPPRNRDPLPDEVSSCRPFLERQIALLAPRMILVVGKIASHALLNTDASMGSLRGRQHRLSIAGRDIPVVATYHPAYLLRSLSEKAKAWEDLCFARSIHERLKAEA
jgi:uracil-DNA glycosylase family 4